MSPSDTNPWGLRRRVAAGARAAVASLLQADLNERVRAHMGACTPADVRRVFPKWRQADAAVALLDLLTSAGAELLAFEGDAADLFGTKTRHALPPGGAPLRAFEVKPGVMREGVNTGLALCRLDGEPAVVQCWHSGSGFTVRALTKAKATADRLLARVEELELAQGGRAARLRGAMANSVNGRLREHFADAEPKCVRHAFPAYLIKNATVLLHRFLQERGAHLVDFATGSRFVQPTVADLWEKPNVSDEGQVKAFVASPPAFEEILIGGDLYRAFERGAAFLEDDGERIALICFVDDHPEAFHLWVLGRSVAAAEASLKKFLAYEEAHSLLRGRLVRPQLNWRQEVEHAEILAHEKVGWGDIVLPADVEERVRGDVVEFARRAPLLRRTGVETKRGVLLHGPPGTGKTLLCRLLASELPGFSTIVVAGVNLRHAAAVFALARRLAPSLVVLEDVDLIGQSRQENGAREALGSLLNELDGMGRHDQVIVVLTTNRLEVLEEALVERPGRVDTVIGLPSPSAELRRRLLRLFAGRASVDGDAIDALVERTPEASPAFLREVMKRAVLLCPDPAEDAPVVIDKGTALRALDAMMDAHKDRSARRIIGFAASAKP
jgi:hypothetical protein